MHGKITKGVGGFYTVLAEDNNIICCKAKGALRNMKITPLVGDEVIIQEHNDGYIIKNILERKNMLIRPNVANVSQVLIVMACTRPEPNFMMLDKLIAICENIGLNIILCFNKTDLADTEKIKNIKSIYDKTPYKNFFISAKNKISTDLSKVFHNNTTVLAGPSGAGKSTLINTLCPSFYLNTGDISEKIGRGKHTTRHTELLVLDNNSYIVDTPGFTNIDIADIEYEDIKYCFNEFLQYEGMCRYNTCMHDSEPGCRVKTALSENEISQSRYKNYIAIKNEILNTPRSYKK